MPGIMSSVLVLATFLLSRVASSLVLAFSRHHGVFDQPSHRSSHVVPTPRGGGLAIVLAILTGLTVAALSGMSSSRTAVAIGGGIGLVATVGWAEDRRGVPAWVRLLVHFGAAAWAVSIVDGLPGTDDGLRGLVAWISWVVGIAWATNLYNFMDGIDGLAAGQAVVAGVGAALLLHHRGLAGLALDSLLLAAAAAGFLPLNWSPAKIFMGDVGSGVLGFAFGALALTASHAAATSVTTWVVLFGVFVFDASVTLLRRLARGARADEPHRSHAYQRAVQAGWSHATVTGAALGLTAVLAVLASFVDSTPALPVAVAVGVLVIVYVGVGSRMPFPGR